MANFYFLGTVKSVLGSSIIHYCTFFVTRFLNFNNHLNKVKTKLKSTSFIFPDYTNVINSFEMTLNPKHRTEKRKTRKEKDIKTRKTKIQRDENLVFRRVARNF